MTPHSVSTPTRHRVALMLAATLLTAAGAAMPTASAADATAAPPPVIRLYAGNGCLATNGADISKLIHLASGAFNFSPDSFDLTCPIIRVRPSSTTGVEVLVTVRRTSSKAGLMTCALEAFQKDGLRTVAGDFKTLTDPELSTVRVLRLRLPKSAAHGHYGLECFLSPDYGIVNYEVREN